jgi:hypothetical protein
LKVDSVSIKGSKVVVKLASGRRLPTYRIKVTPHCKNVASWWSTKGDVLKIDDDIAGNKRYVKSLVVHEVVEEQIVRSLPKKMPANVKNILAHKQATEIERDFHIRKLGGMKSWVKYSREVNRVAKKEGNTQ